MKRVGLIVNPLAGLGGAVGLKGSDGEHVVARARELGAVPVAAARAERTLARLESRQAPLLLVAAPGEMGADLAAAHAFPTEVLALPGRPAGATTAADTRAAARELERRGVDLILFAGGDGTTRDVLDAVGGRVPVLGIPTGVKMHSAVFATTPENAGEVVSRFVSAERPPALRDGEVVDVDEDAVRAGRLSTRLYGVLRVPDDPGRVQAAKAAGPARTDEAELAGVCAEVAAGLDPARLTVLGPGTTTRRIMQLLGHEKTLLGVDAVRDGRVVARDASERTLLELLTAGPATLVVGVVGGQGALFGRGNQQLGPAVLRAIGPGNVEIVAGLRKLLALEGTALHVDTGDPLLDAELSGYRRVRFAPGRSLLVKVVA